MFAWQKKKSFPNELSELERFFATKKNWASETRDKYQRVLDRFLSDYPNTSNLGPDTLASWLEAQPWGLSMANVALGAIKQWIRWKHGESHPALMLKIPRSKPKPQRTLTLEQVIMLLESFDTSTPIGRRDLAMCTLFLDTGLRVSEICRLEMRYLYLSTRRLDVIVKGGTWETAVYSAYTANYLLAWLADREQIAATDTNTVFVGVGGNTPGQPMTRDGIKTNVRTWGKRAGIGKLSPHDFRRTFATLGIRLGAPTRIVQEAGRWKSVKMVERYTQAIQASDFDPYFPVMAALRLNTD